MSSNSSILVLGRDGEAPRRLAERVRGLGQRAVRAPTPLRALEIARERSVHYPAALICADPELLEQRGLLAQLRERSPPGEPTLIAAGPAPEAPLREALREAGVEIALFDPVGDPALRFFLNRATLQADGVFPRGEPRAPTDLQVRIFSGGRAKQAALYCLSSGGAFFATPSPWLAGAEVAIELPLDTGALAVVGRVLYTNVPGNLQRPGLPAGMAVRFRDTSAEERRALGRAVEASAGRYAL